MDRLPNKRAFLRPILDKIEEGWEIQKPSALDPTDNDFICLFLHPQSGRQARVVLPTNWFRDAGLFPEIELAVRMSIRNAAAPPAPDKK